MTKMTNYQKILLGIMLAGRRGGAPVILFLLAASILCLPGLLVLGVVLAVKEIVSRHRSLSAAPLLLLGVAIAGLTISSACYDPHAQESAIVREIEANGSGDLSTYTAPGLGQWFSVRPQFATRIAAECAPLARSSRANWITSAEGVACSAATQAAPAPIPVADTRSW